MNEGHLHPSPVRCRARALCAAVAALAAGGVLTAGAGEAWADEPRSAKEPRIQRDPGDIVDVADSFDEGDPFDIRISLGFQYINKSATIQRETASNQPGLTTGGYVSRALAVAAYNEQTSRLTPRVEVGLYKDLALYFALPITLVNSRELKAPAGGQGAGATAGAAGETLFSVPFRAPDRGGVENLTVGLHFDLMNQFRDPSKPTWLLGFEGRFAVGTPMRACNNSPAAGQVRCAHPSDVNRNGVPGESFEGNFPTRTDGGDPGVTRGTWGFEAHTYLSRRIKYIEPYGGFSALVEVPQDGSELSLTNLKGSLVNLPPIVGTMTLGLMIHPWEDREKQHRLTFDLRFEGQYRSEGRDYSELFDALGSSSAASIRNPNYGAFTGNPNYSAADCNDGNPNTPCLPRSVIDPSTGSAYFTGLTNVAAHGGARGSASVTWQPSEYVKLNLGMGVGFVQGHGLTVDAPCNPNFGDATVEESGFCQAGDLGSQNVVSTGIPNPNYRPPINSVGRRFFVDDATTFDVFASGTVMF